MKTATSLLTAFLLSVSFAPATDRIFGFDASDLGQGDVSLSDIEKAARSQGNPSQQSLGFHAKTALGFEVLADEKSNQFLRIRLPGPGAESRNAVISFRDSKWADFLNPSLPVVLEYKIQTSSDSMSIASDALFARGDKFQAIGLFRTPLDRKPRTEMMFNLTANDPTTITVTLSVQDGSILANVKAKSQGGLADDKEWTLPASEKLTLADLGFLNLTINPEEGDQNAKLDLFSVSISQ